MTTKIWIPQPIGFHASATTASISTWIEDLRQAFLAVGVTQTSDTGQFDSSTFTYTAPGDLNGTSSEKTYLMFAFNDSLQSTAPIYFRVGILAACGNEANGYQLGSSIEVGSATNGSGTITTNSSGKKIFFVGYDNYGRANSSENYQSFMNFSSSKGFFGCVYNAGFRYLLSTSSNSNSSPLKFFIERIPDSSGTPTNSGYSLWFTNQSYNAYNYTSTYSDSTSYTNVSVQQVTTVLFGQTVITSNNSYSIPYFGSTSVVSPDLFVNHGYHITPTPVRSNGILAYKQGAINHGTEFDATVYGTTPSHFIAMDYRAAIRPCVATTSADFAFLFE